ncbi:MAG TPA: beta-ketoacyl-ACP synthase II [Candidatus Tectomicrobia bacterium]|jgi:3-oxoacyl-[acyl-carrier-protein] synthase II
MDRRVVVTGLGAITPLGIHIDTVWERICHGASGIKAITRFDTTDFPVQIAGEAWDFVPEQYLDKRDIRRTDRFVQFALAASQEAIQNAGLSITDANADRVGVYIGTAFGGLESLEAVHKQLLEKGPNRVSPLFPAIVLGNLAAGQVSMRFGACGPNNSSVTACAAGAHSIGEAFHIIGRGAADVIIAGGTEAVITPLAVSAFGNMRALSTRNKAPQEASRPFERDRDGFVMAEGAGILILEELQHARRRGAYIYAEIVGYGSAADAYHLTAPCPDGAGAARCIQNALRDANLSADAVDHINAHATSTSAGDMAETLAIKTVFKARAHAIPISATKSMTGHLLGAAGAVESIFTILALRDGLLPPTINYQHPDPACDLDYVPNAARQATVRTAMCNAFGFGGTNAALLFRKFGV